MTLKRPNSALTVDLPPLRNVDLTTQVDAAATFIQELIAQALDQTLLQRNVLDQECPHGLYLHISSTMHCGSPTMGQTKAFRSLSSLPFVERTYCGIQYVDSHWYLPNTCRPCRSGRTRHLLEPPLAWIPPPYPPSSSASQRRSLPWPDRRCAPGVPCRRSPPLRNHFYRH
jgi:hypothetical protein